MFFNEILLLMNTNIGRADKIIRILICVLIYVAYFQGMLSGIAAMIAISISWILIITVVLGVCPIYKVFGFSTGVRKKV